MALYLLFAAIFLPIICGISIYVLEKKGAKKRNFLALAGSALTLTAVAAVYPYLRTAGVLSFTFYERLPLGLYLDETSYILALITAFLWLLFTVSSIDYMNSAVSGDLYYPFLVFSLGASLGIFFSGDFFTMFLFYQLMIVSTYLIIVNRRSTDAYREGFHYMSLAVASGVCLLFATALSYHYSGSVSLAGASRYFSPEPADFLVIFLFFVLAFGIMATAYPYFVWQQDGHPLAPSPLAALLAVVMLKTAAYGSLRVVNGLFSLSYIRHSPGNTVLLVISFFLLAAACYMTVKQRTIKRRLAHSALMQQGYLMLNLSLFTDAALHGRLYHLFFYIFIIAVVFLSCGIMIWRTGKNSIGALAISARQLPVTAFTYTNAALIAAVIPLYKGFLLLAEGGTEKVLYLYLPGLVAVSLFNAFIYLPVTVGIWFSRNEKHKPNKPGYVYVLPVMNKKGGDKQKYSFRLEAPLSILVTLLLLNLACVAFVLLSL